MDTTRKYKRNDKLLISTRKGWRLVYFYMEKDNEISYMLTKGGYVHGKVASSEVIDAAPFDTGMMHGCAIDPRAVTLDKISKLETKIAEFKAEIEGIEADIAAFNREIDTLKKSID